MYSAIFERLSTRTFSVFFFSRTVVMRLLSTVLLQKTKKLAAIQMGYLEI